jgi:chorismate lyase/3-hydroxybenzoate synthase
MSANHLFAILELAEADYGGLHATAREAYQRLAQFQRTTDYRYAWRIWNFLDAINEPEDDLERYQQFCLGRAEGLAGRLDGYPAASALGRRDGDRTLQVIWLAGRVPGRPVENPRQISAYRYPPQYGPAAPSFSRAMLAGDQILISGTSSIVGHETVHVGNVSAQLDESITNLRAVISASDMPEAKPTQLKAYVRHERHTTAVMEGIRTRCHPEYADCILLADICRADLLVELEAIGQR